MTEKALNYNGLGLFYWFEIQQYIESYKFTNSFLIHKTYIPLKTHLYKPLLNNHIFIIYPYFLMI